MIFPHHSHMPTLSYEQIVRDLRKCSSTEKAKHMAKYLKTSDLEFYGLKLPDIHKITKSYAKNMDIDELRHNMIRLWELPIFETRRAAINFMTKFARKGNVEVAIRIASTWIEDIDTWALVDPLCSPCIGIMLLRNWNLTRTLESWHNSPNYWRRRASFLPYLYLALKKAYKPEYTEIILGAVLPHISDEEFFVGKAVGWVLRELSKRNPDAVRQFIREYKNKMTKLVIREGSKKLE
ncbi:MAG: hypothetical protein GF411_09100 [Candidatus Lokiarchaeota archaeon]|nr:hypothetical protein [Candidatus Lokiarchaeota archaeon]